MPLTVPFDGFDWDDGNRGKCQKHGAEIAEVESMFLGASVYTFEDAAHSNTEIRYIGTGQAESWRCLFVVFTLRRSGGRRLIRPLSARYMHAKEAARHEQSRQAAEKAPGSEN